MSNEVIRVYGTTKTLEANGAACASTNSTVDANDANYSVSADGSSYPDAEFVLSLTMATAPTYPGHVMLLARPLNVDGTADTEPVSVAFPGVLIGSFIINNVATLQYVTLVAKDVPQEASYSLFNSAGSIAAGWTLKVKPRTNKAAP